MLNIQNSNKQAKEFAKETVIIDMYVGSFSFSQEETGLLDQTEFPEQLDVAEN